MDAVIPPEIPEWNFIMDAWGSKMLNALNVTAVMASKGFGLPSDAFSSRLFCGPHLLAPTGSDYSVSGEEGTVLAGFHYDLNFLTIHGKSRYPGLYVWTRSGQRVAVAVPNGCLLVQVCTSGLHFVLTFTYYSRMYLLTVTTPLSDICYFYHIGWKAA